MHERPSAVVFAASLVLAWPVAAEKPAAPVQPASRSADQRAPAEMASAEPVKLPVQFKVSDSPAVPKKPRAARVTTCRCGDLPQQ